MCVCVCDMIFVSLCVWMDGKCDWMCVGVCVCVCMCVCMCLDGKCDWMCVWMVSVIGCVCGW